MIQNGSKWHYLGSDNKPQGPVDFDIIMNMCRKGTLKPDNLVWTKTFGNEWKRIAKVPELAEACAWFEATGGHGNQANNMGGNAQFGAADGNGGFNGGNSNNGNFNATGGNPFGGNARGGATLELEPEAMEREEEVEFGKQDMGPGMFDGEFIPFKVPFKCVDIRQYLKWFVILFVITFLSLFLLPKLFNLFVIVLVGASIALSVACAVLSFNFFKMLSNDKKETVWRPWLLIITQIALPVVFMSISGIFELMGSESGAWLFAIVGLACSIYPTFLLAFKGEKSYERVDRVHIIV